MNGKNWKGPLFLLLAAMVWGVSFVAQDLASDTVEPFTFNGLRMTLGGLALLPVVMVKNRGGLFALVSGKKKKRRLLWGGALCGVILYFAAFFQQYGIACGTTAGKSGFITAMYVVLVPFVGVFLGRRVRPVLWLCIFLSAVGLYCLCLANFSLGWEGVLSGLRLGKGDGYTFLCALCFTLHIMVVDVFAPETDGVLLSAVQFLVAGAMGLVSMFVFENPTVDGIIAAAGAILYGALISCAIGYTFQILGQKTTPPALASILMCLESVFAVLSDAILLKTAMTVEEVVGCVLMFAAIVGSNISGVLPQKKTRKA